MRSNFPKNSCLFQQNKLSVTSPMEAFSNNSEMLSTITGSHVNYMES